MAEIDSMREGQKAPENEIFSLITERTNVPNARRHISADVVLYERSRRALSRHVKASASMDELREWNDELLDETSRLETIIKSHEADLDADEALIDDFRDQRERLRSDLFDAKSEAAALRMNLTSQRASRDESSFSPDELCREALRSVNAHKGTPAQCLRLVQAFYADRLVVLDSAYASAESSEGFRYGERLLELLLTLVDDYAGELRAGRPDAEARKVFPPAKFAAKEAGTLAESARDRRRFEYNNSKPYFEAHLKVGDTKGSADTTLRVHFIWDAAAQKIVIGHCGEHLPF